MKLIVMMALVFPMAANAKMTKCVAVDASQKSEQYAFITTSGSKLLFSLGSTPVEARAEKDYYCSEDGHSYSCVIQDAYSDTDGQPYTEAIFNGHSFSFQVGESEVKRYTCE